MVTFSLIIPVYNRAKELPRLFEALRALDVDNLQLIFVDNASSDASQQLCRDFVETLNGHRGWRMEVYFQLIPGAAAARQLGLDKAVGEWVYFFDSDDVISPDFFLDVAAFVDAERDELDMVCVPVEMFMGNGRHKVRDYECTADASVHIVMGMLATVNFVVRRDFLCRAGGWNKALRRGDDWELALRLLLLSPRLKWMTGRAYHQIIIHPESMSGKPFVEDWHAISDVIEAAYDDLSKAQGGATRGKMFQALASKTLLVAARMYREGGHDLSSLFRHRAMRMMPQASLLLKVQMTILYWLSAHGVPGIWRCYRRLL